jgi:hypothetical protein
VTRIAYIVSAYKLPAQLERLLRRLQAPGVTIAVHVDRKTRRPVWEEMIARCRDLDVTWLPRHRSQWGGFGHVRATLKGLDHIVESDVPFDYAVLLTGQDYPLRPAEEIARELGELKVVPSCATSSCRGIRGGRGAASTVSRTGT